MYSFLPSFIDNTSLTSIFFQSSSLNRKSTANFFQTLDYPNKILRKQRIFLYFLKIIASKFMPRIYSNLNF